MENNKESTALIMSFLTMKGGGGRRMIEVNKWKNFTFNLL